LLTSTPFYAQANGQVEAANKIINNLIKKHTHAKPKNWHKTLNRVFWACRTFPRESTNYTPFRLVLGRKFTSGNLCTISQSTKENGNSNRSILGYEILAHLF